MDDKLRAFLTEIRKEINANPKDGHCIVCNEPFSDKNVHTELGWRETKLSQNCEDCWDKLMSECTEDEPHEA